MREIRTAGSEGGPRGLASTRHRLYAVAVQQLGENPVRRGTFVFSNKRRLPFIGEWQNMDIDIPVSSYLSGFPFSQSVDAVRSKGWYLSGSRRFEAFEIGYAYGETYANRDDKEGLGYSTPSNAYTKDHQFSIRYDVTEFWTLKSELHSISGTSRLYNEFMQNSVRDQESWSLFAVKSTFNF